MTLGSGAINCTREHKTLIGSPNSPSHNPASTKKQKISTSPYRTTVLGLSVAKVCNGCGLNAHNKEHHNWGNCQRRTHPEFNNEERVAYALSAAGRTATIRRHAGGPTPYRQDLSTPYQQRASSRSRRRRWSRRPW